MLRWEIFTGRYRYGPDSQGQKKTSSRIIQLLSALFPHCTVYHFSPGSKTSPVGTTSQKPKEKCDKAN